MPLADILACPAEELEAILGDENPYDRGAWFMAKNIGMIELCQLGELLQVDSYDSLTGEFNLVGEPLPEGPWPQTVPTALSDKLAKLDDREIAAVCPKWSGIEEFDGATPADVLADYLRRLRAFLQANQGPYFLVNAL